MNLCLIFVIIRYQNIKTDMKKLAIILSTLFLLTSCGDDSEKIGSASTKFNLLGRNDRIEIEHFQDADFKDIHCYISFAKKGGISETVNMEEDTSNFNLSCIKNTDAEIKVPDHLKKRAEVYKRRANFTFKTMQVERYYDENQNVLVYMAYSDRVLDGSPHNAVSAVTLFGVQPVVINQPNGWTTYNQEKAKQKLEEKLK